MKTHDIYLFLYLYLYLNLYMDFDVILLHDIFSKRKTIKCTHFLLFLLACLFVLFCFVLFGLVWFGFVCLFVCLFVCN